MERDKPTTDSLCGRSPSFLHQKMFSSTFWLQDSVLLNICLCQKMIVQDTLNQILSDVEYIISNSNDGHFACVFQGNCHGFRFGMLFSCVEF